MNQILGIRVCSYRGCQRNTRCGWDASLKMRKSKKNTRLDRIKCVKYCCKDGVFSSCWLVVGDHLIQVDSVFFVDEMADSLRSSLSGDRKLYVLSGVNTDSGKSCSGAKFESMDEFKVDKSLIFPILVECRVKKTPEEIEVQQRLYSPSFFFLEKPSW